MPACRRCGAKIRWFDLTCRQCGTRNEKLRDWLEIGALAAVLAIAIPTAAYIATHRRPPTGGVVQAPRPPSQAPAAAAPVATPPAAPVDAAPADDYAWLEAAMKTCDDQASKDKDGLYFLVIPLDLASANIPNWRPRNQIGNALVLLGKDTLDGLKQQTLVISKDEYVLSVRNATDQAIHRFAAATGVKQFRHPDPKTVSSFDLQYKPRNGRDDDWGNPLDRQAGVCFWVPALTRP